MYFVNIDEVNFNHKLVKNYSWLEKGKNQQIMNLFAQNSCSMITGFTNDGEFIGMIVKKSVTSDEVNDFLSILTYALTHKNKHKLRDILFTMDNAAIHWSAKTKSHYENLGLKVAYLPPYWPALAPVELLFKIIKTKIRSMSYSNNVDYLKDSGTDLIIKAMASLEPTKISSIWRSFINNWTRFAFG